MVQIREKAVTELTRLLAGQFRDMIWLGQELAVEDWLRQGLIGLASEVCQNDIKPIEILNGKPVFIKDEWTYLANLFYLCQKSYKASPQGRAICCGSWIGPYHGSDVCGSCRKFWNNVSIAQLVDEVFSAELAKARNEPLLAVIDIPLEADGPPSS